MTIFGSSWPVPGDPGFEEGLEVGRRLAQAGYAVCTGGYAGVMEAVSRGAAEAGGEVIGVTTDDLNPLQPNRWLTREVRTRDFLERLDTLIRPAAAYLVLRGGVGTLAELAFTWNLLQTGVLPGRPLLVLGESWRHIVQGFRGRLLVAEGDYEWLVHVEAPGQVVSALEEALRAARRRRPVTPPAG